MSKQSDSSAPKAPQALHEALFGPSGPFSRYITGRQAADQGVLSDLAVAFILRMKEKGLDVETIEATCRALPLCNKSALDQKLDSLGLIDRAKGSRPSAKLISDTLAAALAD